MSDFCLPAGYRENLTPARFEDSNPNLVSQPDVYWHAAWLASALGATQYLDVGCGRAGKLEALHYFTPHRQFIGVDLPEVANWCRQAYGWGIWVGYDLEAGLPPFDLGDPTVMVIADVIEHLLDPRPLLRAVRELTPVVAILLSTPERDLTHGEGHLGPPPNPCHVREWNTSELERFLDSQGLTDESGGMEVGYTRSDDANGGLNTILVVVA